jgi:hypothetical protein
MRYDAPMRRFQVISLIGGAAFALAGCSAMQDASLADAGVTQFRQQMSEQKFAEIYAQGTDELKRTTTEQKFTAVLAAVDRKLGSVKESKKGGWNVNWTPTTTTVTVAYKTQFERGSGDERFVFRISGGKAQLASYTIDSTELITN